jgi:hypothetical protein
MQTPCVNAVGIVEEPAGYESRPRSYDSSVRIIAGLLLGTFLFVSLTTSIVSLASYCLTSHAGAPFPFPG